MKDFDDDHLCLCTMSVYPFLIVQGVLETESLEERLLCVEINDAAVHVTQIVLEVVASIAPFVSFVTLGNRVHGHK